MDDGKKILEMVKESVTTNQNIILDEKLIDKICDSVSMVETALTNGNKILFCGNGGSSAEADHLAAELMGRFLKDRPGLYAEALHCSGAYMSAVSNDYSFDVVFERQILTKGNPGDVLIAMSTSGNSINVVRALKAAKEKSMRTICMTGDSGGLLAAEGGILINIPSKNTARIQEAHLLIGHIICQLVEERIFP